MKKSTKKADTNKWKGCDLPYLIQAAIMTSMRVKGKKDSPLKLRNSGIDTYYVLNGWKVGVLEGINRIVLRDPKAINKSNSKRYTGEQFIAMLKEEHGIEISQRMLNRARKVGNPVGWHKFYEKLSSEAFRKWNNLDTRWLPD